MNYEHMNGTIHTAFMSEDIGANALDRLCNVKSKVLCS